MRLICGLWNLTGAPVAHDTLLAMCMALQSQVKPGSIDIWTDGPIGFGLLGFGEDMGASITALHPPGLVTAADIRLDEGRSLRLGYGLPHSLKDAETVAGLPMQEVATDVLGDFAVAQWNPSARKLVLARDALGIRPICYHHLPGRCVAFASFPAGIFAAGLMERQLDRKQLALELISLPVAEATLFHGVRNVSPGHTISFSAQGEQADCYWRPTPQPAHKGLRQDAAVQLRQLLQDAVDACLEHTGPVAAHLSGGLDSSALCVMASRTLQGEGRQLLAYSFLSETWPGLPIEGERPYVQAVLQQEPAMRWQEVGAVFSPDWLHDDWSPDAPLVRSHGSPENTVCFDASNQGAGVVLSGWGGDEGITFNGRGAFAEAFRRGKWVHLAKELQGMRRERGFPLSNMAFGDIFGPLLSPRFSAGVRRAVGRKRRTEPAMTDFFSPELQALASSSTTMHIEADTAKMQARLLTAGHVSFRAARFAAIGAAYGMAFRFPLLNRRVVEFALGMPPAWHIHAGWKRRLFREAMEGILPPLVQWRHSKFRSLPKVPYQFAVQREAVLQRVEQLAAHPVVSSLFRMDQAAAVLRVLPDPGAVKNPGTDPALAALPYLAQLLDYAFFIEQQFPA